MSGGQGSNWEPPDPPVWREGSTPGATDASAENEPQFLSSEAIDDY
ncbi:MAG: hypothetical protein ACLFVU_13395 [Phycisphaerae bacterium]